MGILSWFSTDVSENEDDLEEKAAELVSAARINATGAFGAFAEKYEVVESIDVDKWDDVLTVASVWLAISVLPFTGISDKDEGILLDRIGRELVARVDSGLKALQDCGAFVDRTYKALEEGTPDGKYNHVDALGAWIAWNLLDRAPESKQDREFTRAIGLLVNKTFADWWSVAEGTESVVG